MGKRNFSALPALLRTSRLDDSLSLILWLWVLCAHLQRLWIQQANVRPHGIAATFDFHPILNTLQ